VKLVVTEVQRGVDWLERLEINVDFSFFALGCQDFTAIDDKAVRWNLAVEFEPLLSGGNGGEDAKTVDARLDVGGSTELFSQHL